MREKYSCILKYVLCSEETVDAVMSYNYKEPNVIIDEKM